MTASVSSRADLTTAARMMRADIVRMAAGTEGAHLGGSLSCTDILAVLFLAVLNHDGEEPDRFVLSKGHAAPALYAALVATGRLDRSELAGFAAPGSRLFGHPPRGLPGVEFPTGSLGHGLGLASGLALAARLRGGTARTFVLLGDGELQEGSNWEALMFAGQQRLSGLTAIVDRNGFQITGPVSMEPLTDRLRAFGWDTTVVDGHDLAAVEAALAPRAGDRPVAVVADTVKGKGVRFLEGRPSSHYVKLGPDLLRRALGPLEAGER